MWCVGQSSSPLSAPGHQKHLEQLHGPFSILLVVPEAGKGLGQEHGSLLLSFPVSLHPHSPGAAAVSPEPRLKGWDSPAGGN